MRHSNPEDKKKRRKTLRRKKRNLKRNYDKRMNKRANHIRSMWNSIDAIAWRILIDDDIIPQAIRQCPFCRCFHDICCLQEVCDDLIYYLYDYMCNYLEEE